MRKFCNEIFWIGDDPPPLPPFLEITLRFFSKIYRFETNKICNVIFWIGNDPLPPLAVFQKNIHFWGDGRPLVGQVLYILITLTKCLEESGI